MKRAWKVLIGAAAVAGLGWLYWQWQFPTCTFNYRLTVEVETPEGVKSGSGVLEVQLYPAFIFATGGPDWHSRISEGEAVPVDLGSGKNLFVLLTANEVGRGYFSQRDGLGALGADDLALVMLTRMAKAMDPALRVLDLRGSCRAASSFAANPSLTIELSNLPTLVTFGSLSQPESLRVVQPDRLDRELGPGYVLKQVSFQLTSDPPEERIETVLPWLVVEKERWRRQLTFGLGRSTLDNINFDSFKEPGLWEP